MLQVLKGMASVRLASLPTSRRVLMQLEGIAAIVTGGASGLGAATAAELARRGARVVIADISDAKGKAVADSVGGAFAHVDVTSTDDIIAAAELAKPKLRLVLMPRSPLVCCFAVPGGVCPGYFPRVSGIGTPMRSKAWRCSLVGSVRTGISAGAPANWSWLRVRVPRWASRPPKLRYGRPLASC